MLFITPQVTFEWGKRNEKLMPKFDNSEHGR